MAVMHLTSDADSDMGSPHNSLLMLARSSDSLLPSKLPQAMYTAAHMTLKRSTTYIHTHTHT